jgi:putative endonuclease
VPAASPMRTAKRRVGRDRGAAQRHGLAAETWAAWRLRLAGYRVLAVEVKARADDTAAAEALQPMQRQRIRNAAAAFLARRPDLAGLDLRFDVVLVVPRRLPRHIQDAWRDSG